MQKGQRFTIAGQVYYIELIGPRTTLCASEDGSRESFDTAYLRRILNIENNSKRDGDNQWQ